nr:uncharacterized protein LOC133578987 [Nerophis lumbriciformis]
MQSAPDAAAPGAPGAPGADGAAPGGGPPAPPNTSSNRRLQQTQAQVEEVVDIMRVNVDKVLERDQKLSELDDRADALQAGASQFESCAAKLKNKYWWKNCKMMIMMGIIGVIVVGIIFLMPTVDECVCCGEQERVREKMEGAGVQCITQHPGFQPVCLNVDVLQTAYYAYRQNYEDQSGNNWKRYTAYRQFVRWVYEFLGRRIRVPLPACVVAQIRTSFPSPEFVGYQPCNPP